ncbi:MAG: S16 family serine protease, partial [Oscillospiraceae bacterium]
ADAAIYMLIDSYTREAGVRSLERTINEILRKCAKKIASEETDKININAEMVRTLLGPARIKPGFSNKKDSVGVANGLAWTSVGGELLPIEVQLIEKGSGKLELTGSLGDVMKESAKIAITYAKAHASELGFDLSVFKDLDIHIHAPEGAIPKDGPSAGVTLTTALVSALSGRKVRSDIAMTGEITLHGQVLAIGGLKEKSMAAYREGMKLILIPSENMSDLYEIDDEVKNAVKFMPMNNLDEVLKLALCPLDAKTKEKR